MAGRNWRRKRRTAPGVSQGCQTCTSPGQQQLFALGAAGGGAVGEQQAHAGQLLAQLGQQNGGGPGFAQRYGVDPDKAVQRVGAAWGIRLSMGRA